MLRGARKRGQASGSKVSKEEKKRNINRKGKERPSTPKTGELHVEETSGYLIFVIGAQKKRWKWRKERNNRRKGRREHRASEAD